MFLVGIVSSVEVLCVIFQFVSICCHSVEPVVSECIVNSRGPCFHGGDNSETDYYLGAIEMTFFFP